MTDPENIPANYEIIRRGPLCWTFRHPDGFSEFNNWTKGGAIKRAWRHLEITRAMRYCVEHETFRNEIENLRE